MMSVDAAYVNESETGAHSEWNSDVLAVGKSKSEHRQKKHHSLIEDQRTSHRKRQSGKSIDTMEMFPLIYPGTDTNMGIPPQSVLDEKLNIT